MKKLIIIEGIDSTGKTSLSKAIQINRAKKFGIAPVLFHCTASPSLFVGLHDYHMNVAKFCKSNLDAGHDVVLDRFWPSEVCYGRVFRPTSDYQQTWHNIKMEIMNYDPIYVFCDSENAWPRYVEEDKYDPAHSLSPDNFRRVQMNYVQLFDSIRKMEIVRDYSIEEHGQSSRLQTFIDSLYDEKELRSSILE